MTESALAQLVVPPPPSGPANDVHGVPCTLTLDEKLPTLLRGFIQVRYTEAPDTADAFQIKRLRLIKFRREAQVRVGQFKVPFSGESLAADERTIPIERSMVVNQFSPGRDNGSQGRDLGVVAMGNVGGENRRSVEYAAAFVNGSGIYDVPSTRHKAFSTRVIFHPVAGLSMGEDFYKGRSNRRALRPAVPS